MADVPGLDLPAPPPKRKLTKAERLAQEEKRKREAAREAAKRGPKNAPKLGKFKADREQADESLRVVGLFKEFAERGRVPERHVGMLIKDLFKDASKKGGLADKLQGMAREALPPKAASDKGLTAGDFSAWYFEACWPLLVEAKAADKAAAAEQKAIEDEEAKAAAEVRREEERAAAEAAAAAAAEKKAAKEAAKAAARAAAAPSPPQQPSPPQPTGAGGLNRKLSAGRKSPPNAAAPGAGRAKSPPQADPRRDALAKSAPPLPTGAAEGAPSADAGALSAAVALPEPVLPAGWAAARGVDAAEARRVVAAVARFVSDGPPLLSEEGGGDPRMVAPGLQKAASLCLPPRAVAPAVRAALLRHAKAEGGRLSEEEVAGILKEAPKSGAQPVPLGTLLGWWFARVWPAVVRPEAAPAPAEAEEEADEIASPGDDEIEIQ